MRFLPLETMAVLDECTANNGRINSRGYYPRPDTMARLNGGRSRYPLNLRCLCP